MMNALERYDADGIVALVSDPFRFGEILIPRVQFREIVVANAATNAGKATSLVQSIAVLTLEELRHRGLSWGDTDKIVRENNLHPSDYLAKVASLGEHGVHEDLLVIRPVADRYEVIAIIGISSTLRPKQKRKQ